MSAEISSVLFCTVTPAGQTRHKVWTISGVGSHLSSQRQTIQENAFSGVETVAAMTLSSQESAPSNPTKGAAVPLIALPAVLPFLPHFMLSAPYPVS